MNNISLSFQLFASGLLAGLGTLFYLVFNGLYIGAIAGYLIETGSAVPFLSFVAGHGSFELTALVLAGGAGLMLGHALIAPGVLSRVVALQRASRRAIEVIFGSTVMLLIAALIEAFWSSSNTLPLLLKYSAGLIAWVLVLTYLLRAGRTT